MQIAKQTIFQFVPDTEVPMTLEELVDLVRNLQLQIAGQDFNNLPTAMKRHFKLVALEGMTMP